LIVVNPNARIGDWCDIHQGVNIGENTDKKTPVLGNDCWIGPGAKIFGGISIGNNVMIGANAVVTQNFPDNSVVMGIPAEIKKYSGNIYAKELDYKTQKGNNL
jgi:serine O-acetyltransferase